MARSHISSPNCRSRRPNRYTRPDQVVPLFPRTTSAPGPSGCRCPLQRLWAIWSTSCYVPARQVAIQPGR